MDKTAYLSVYDKTGLAQFAAGLETLGYEIYASGSTFGFLKQEGIEAEEARFSPPLPVAVLKALFSGVCALSENGVEVPPPAVVVCDLYPLERLTEQEDLGAEEISIYLDTANSAVLRAAAREFEAVTVLCDRADYSPVLETLKAGGPDQDKKKSLAAKAYAYCAYYDGTLARYLSKKNDCLQNETVLSLKKAKPLSYGENRHQRAAFYALSGARPSGLNSAQILQGAEFNLNHYLDMETAFEMVSYFDETACVIAKHANPCGAAYGLKVCECFVRALDADRPGAFGGTAAFNRKVDAEAAAVLSESFVETVIATDYDAAALKILRAGKNIKVVKLDYPLAAPGEMELFSISGGLLMEEKDNFGAAAAEFRVVSKRQPTPAQSRAMLLAWRAAVFAKSYSVALACDCATIAIGPGQSSTYDAARLAAMKAGQRHPILKAGAPLAAAADAPLPLKTLEEILACGADAVAEPGGFGEDADCIKLCDLKNAVLVFTGVRHLKH